MGIWSTISSPFRTRSYDGAAGGRRWRGQPSMPAPQVAAQIARRTLADRARYAVSNNPLGAAGVNAWVAQAIGAGILASSLHPDISTRDALTASFAEWVDDADADARTDWFGIQQALFRSCFIAGEGLAVMISNEDRLRIRVLDPEQLDASHTTVLDGGHIMQGVEFDASGARVAYHVLDHAPGLDLGIQRHRRRIDARDVLHVFRADWPGQVRGVSHLSASLLRMSDLDSWRDAMLTKLRVAAMMAGFVTPGDGSGGPLDGERQGDSLVGGLTPGQLTFLDPGQSVTFTSPPGIGTEVISFAAIAEREVAIGMGLPAHALGDVGAANYSSLKSANTAWKARVEAMQWSTFIPQVCVPVWRRFATLQVLGGRVQSTVEAAMAVKHICPTWPSLEPVKDITAETMQLESGLTSRRALISSRGEDYDHVMREIAADTAFEKSLGLAFATPQPANSNEPPASAAA